MVMENIALLREARCNNANEDTAVRMSPSHSKPVTPQVLPDGGTNNAPTLQK